MTEPSPRHSTGLVVLHWLSALAVLGAWLTAEGGRRVAENPPLIHFTLGLAVLALVLPRLLLRLAGPAPAPVPQPPLVARAARAGHAILYLLLVALPLSGWYAASRLGVDVSFLGLDLPALAPRVEGRPGLIAELHENGGTLILILAGLHGLMALWHQFVLRDGTLERMSLGRNRPGGRTAGRS